jgi:non-ribosomal peptide synthetase component E (peptide arylation enzyme)
MAPGAPTPTLSELTTHLLKRGLARRKLPELLLMVEEMPLGPTGKICHRTLAARALRHRVPDRSGGG